MIPDESKCVGVKFSPQVIDSWFRDGFSAKIVENAIPGRFKLYNHGYNVEEDVFFFIFKTKDCEEGEIPYWVSPAWKND